MNRTGGLNGAKLAILQTLMFVTMAVPAGAADGGLQTSAIVSSSTQPKIEVQAEAGRYDLIVGSKLTLALQLSAATAGARAGDKIVTSELFLKQAGSGNAAVAMTGLVPQRAFEIEQAFDFPIDPVGPVAQNAISACNSLPGGQSSAEIRTATTTVTLIWRVVTGHFNYKWVTYDRIAKGDEISTNPDFYGDRETHETEMAVRVTVACAPLPASVAKAEADKPAVKPLAATKATPQPVPVTARAGSPTASITKVSADTSTPKAGKPVCGGGFIRQMQSGDVPFLCLCPGNTQRVETGTNAYKCDRRSGRR